MTLKSRALALVDWLENTKAGSWLTVIVILAMGAGFGVAVKTIVDEDPVAPAAPVDAFMPATGAPDAVLSLQTNTNENDVLHRCTATLITTQAPPPDRSQWAATAAHCVTPPSQEQVKKHTAGPQCRDAEPDAAATSTPVDVEATTFTVRGGTSLYATGGLTATVTEIHTAPGWNWTTPSTDLALLRLDQPLNITPVPVATIAPRAKDWVLVDGWTTRPDRCGAIKPLMQQWSLQVDTCHKQSAHQVCASTHHYALAPCDGTSGAPLFTTSSNKISSIAGVYSMAIDGKCYGQVDRAFTSLAQYNDFIATTMSSTG